LAAVTIGPKLVAKPSTNAAPSDARVSTLIDQGDRAMSDGDLDAANEAYVKASALVDQDARVALRLAQLAIVRADVPWLKVRLLAESDPELANTRRELVLAAARAKQAADLAQTILPNDPDVTRCRINTFRQQGNIAEARKLVVSLLKPTGVSNDELIFALLDLAEPSPTWSTVIERLSSAARSEQNLGHARSMLIYALVQSGDMTRAKAELEQLVAMPRPHPLIGAFRAYIAQADKDASAGALAEAGAPADDAATLQSAIEAMTSGEIEKAAEILKDLEARLPNDANVLVAAGKLALKKEDRRTAVKYFEKAIAADKNQFDALAGLANIKWDSGEKQGAIILYRQLIERAAPDNPNIALAKQRFTSYLDGTSEESSN
jgi:tetratricopeptide (TPR) repeat protein